MGYIITAAVLFLLQYLSYLGNQKSLYSTPEFNWTSLDISIWIGSHIPLIIGVILLIVGGIKAVRASRRKNVTTPSKDTDTAGSGVRKTSYESKPKYSLRAAAKEKLVIWFGTFGLVVYFVLSVILAFIPLIFLDFRFWIEFLIIMVISCFQIIGSIVNAVIWIWALVVCIRGPQDTFAIIYYILFGINIFPFVWNAFAALISYIQEKATDIKPKRFLEPVFTILLIISLLLNTYYLFLREPSRRFSQQSEIDSKTQQISKLQAENDSLTAKLDEFDRKNKELNTLSQNRGNTISQLKEENNRLSALVRAYDKNTVLICQTSPTVFHTPDCAMIDPDLCEALVTEAPFGANLLPCTVCHDTYDIYVLDEGKHIYHHLNCPNLPSYDRRLYLTLTVAYHTNYFHENNYQECDFCW